MHAQALTTMSNRKARRLPKEMRAPFLYNIGFD